MVFCMLRTNAFDHTEPENITRQMKKNKFCLVAVLGTQLGLEL